MKISCKSYKRFSMGNFMGEEKDLLVLFPYFVKQALGVRFSERRTCGKYATNNCYLNLPHE